MISGRYRTTRLIGVLSAVALVACNSERGPNLSGSWSGALAGVCAPLLSLTITQGSRGVLTGTASLFSPASCGFGLLNYSVSGEHDHPGVTMTLEPVPGQGFAANRTLTGNVGDADSITATLDGTSVTLGRQQPP